jgi:hypothetical protein
VIRKLYSAVTRHFTNPVIALLVCALVLPVAGQDKKPDVQIDLSKWAKLAPRSLDRTEIGFLSDSTIAISVRIDPPLQFAKCPGGIGLCAPRTGSEPVRVLIVDIKKGRVISNGLLGGDTEGSVIFAPLANGNFIIRTPETLIEFDASLHAAGSLGKKVARYGTGFRVSTNGRHVLVPVTESAGHIDYMVVDADSFSTPPSGPFMATEPGHNYTVDDSGKITAVGRSPAERLAYVRPTAMNGAVSASAGPWCTRRDVLTQLPDCQNPSRTTLEVFQPSSNRPLFSVEWKRGFNVFEHQIALSPSGSMIALWNDGVLSVWKVPTTPN